MNILDFENTATPVAVCDVNGRVIGKNPAAKELRPTLRMGSILKIAPPICRLPQGRCFVIPHDGSLWLLFCSFLRFDFDGAIFPTAREALMLSGENLLKAAALHGTLKGNGSPSRLSALRELLFDKFAFYFSAPADPYRIHSVSRLLRAFQKVLPSQRISFTEGAGSPDLVNTRNATLMMVALLTLMLPHSRGRIKAEAGCVSDNLRISVSAHTDLPLCDGYGEELTDLRDYFPEHSADLFSADLCIRACGYKAFYSTDENGSISVDVYLKTESELFALLDPAEKISFEEELTVLIEQTCQASTHKLHKSEGAPHG